MPVRAQTQVEDSTFVPTVSRPFFTARQPVVMIDEAHNNYFTMRRLYRAFASLLTQDGLRVIPGTALLGTVAPGLPGSGRGQRQPREDVDGCRRTQLGLPGIRVRRGTRLGEGGRALLFIADAAPFASGMDSLAVRFGLQQGKGKTIETREVDPVTGTMDASTTSAAGVWWRTTRSRVGATRPSASTAWSCSAGNRSWGRREHGVPGAEPFFRGPALDAGLAARGHGEDLGEGDALGRSEEARVPAGHGPLPGCGVSPTARAAFVALGDGALFGAQRALGAAASRRGEHSLLIGSTAPISTTSGWPSTWCAGSWAGRSEPGRAA